MNGKEGIDLLVLLAMFQTVNCVDRDTSAK